VPNISFRTPAATVICPLCQRALGGGLAGRPQEAQLFAQFLTFHVVFNAAATGSTHLSSKNRKLLYNLLFRAASANLALLWRGAFSRPDWA